MPRKMIQSCLYRKGEGARLVKKAADWSRRANNRKQKKKSVSE